MIILGEEQQEALSKIQNFIANGKDTSISLSGAAGTGKTLVISYIIKWLQHNRIPYCLCAPTHKAKTVIEHYTNEDAITLHKLLELSPKLDILELDFNNLLFDVKKASSTIPYNGVVICDEASMINDSLFDLLEEMCETNNSKIIFIGDKSQLMPVKSDFLSKVYNLKNQCLLTKIYRQSSENALLPLLQTLREHPVYKLETCKGLEGSLLCESDFKYFFNLILEEIKIAIETENLFRTKVLAFTNARVDKYNEFITRALFGDETKFHKSEIIQCCENLEYNKCEFWNSMEYMIIDVPKQIDIEIPGFIKLPAYHLELSDKHSVDILDMNIKSSTFSDLAAYVEELRLMAIQETNKRLKGKIWGSYYRVFNSFTSPVDLYYDGRLIRKKSFTRGYATTVHKSQGSSYNKVFVDLVDILRCRDSMLLRQLEYVALSRTRSDAIVYQRV